MVELKDKDVEQVVGGDGAEKSAGTAGYFVDPPETSQCVTKNPFVPTSSLIIPD